MQTNFPCDLCGQHHAAPYLKLSQQPFVVVQCANCGLVYLDPRPAPDEMGQFYTTDYYTSQAPAEPKVDTRERVKELAYKARCEYANPEDSSLLRRVSGAALGWRAVRRVPVRQHGRLLDVGCGNGEYAAWIRDHISGWEVEGVEVNEHAAAQAQRTFGVTVHAGHLPDLKLPASHYDMVSFWHSLEHTHSPAAALKEAHRILRGEGWLAIEVPNIGSWEARQARANWYHLAPPVHLYHFTPKTLAHLIEACGFRVIAHEPVRSNASLVSMAENNHWHLPAPLQPAAKMAARTAGRLSAFAMRMYAVKK